MRIFNLCLAIFAFTGCVTTAPTELPLPKDLPQQCEQHCGGMGMRLSAVVIILSKSGCVCEPVAEGGASQSKGGGAAAVGGAAVHAIMQASQPTGQQH